MHTHLFKKGITFILSFTLFVTPIMAKAPEITAEGAILIEPKTNTILYTKNANQKLYPASMTKIMTALIIAEEMPFLRQYDVKIIANISGNTPEEYGIMCEKLADAGVDMIEVNISCPNVKAGGLAYGTKPELAAEVTEVAKKHAGKVPVMVKMSPNVTDITEIARAIEGAGADAVSLINTLRGMRIDINTGRPILKMNTGGLSGPAVLPVAVRMVWEVANAVKIPILGMGGVSTGSDAVQMMMAGADAVAVGTACIADPYAPITVRDELAAFACNKKIDKVSDLTGSVKPWQ